MAEAEKTSFVIKSPCTCCCNGEPISGVIEISIESNLHCHLEITNELLEDSLRCQEHCVFIPSYSSTIIGNMRDTAFTPRSGPGISAPLFVGKPDKWTWEQYTNWLKTEVKKLAGNPNHV